MAMQNRATVYYGNRLIEQSNQLPVLQKGLVSGQDGLYDVFTTRGNGKDATRHEFSKYGQQRRKGIINRATQGGNAFYRETGVSGSYGYSAAADGSQFNTLDSQVIGKLYDQLRGTLDASIDLIQHQQVRKMVVGRAERSIANLIHTVRKMRHAPSRVASNLWLEYTYGVKPLMSSIQGIMAEAVNPQEGLVQIRVRGSKQEYSEVKQSSALLSNAKDLHKVLASYRTEYFCCYNPNNALLLERLGRVSSLNPISIAYELIPYSFVVDWFYDLGGYLRMYESSTLYASSFVKGWRTRTYRINQASSTNFLGFDALQPTTSVFIDMRGLQEVKDYKRSRLTATPFPPLPRFRADVGASRLLSAVALARGQVPRSLDFQKDFWKSADFRNFKPRR